MQATNFWFGGFPADTYHWWYLQISLPLTTYRTRRSLESLNGTSYIDWDVRRILQLRGGVQLRRRLSITKQRDCLHSRLINLSCIINTSWNVILPVLSWTVSFHPYSQQSEPGIDSRSRYIRDIWNLRDLSGLRLCTIHPNSIVQNSGAEVPGPRLRKFPQLHSPKLLYITMP